MPDTPGIVHKSIGWETFKEYQSKPQEAAAGAAGGMRQNVLSTIEFAISPFVPFSQEYTMAYGDLPGNGFAMHASSGPLSQDWLDIINAGGGREQIELDVANSPTMEAEEAAAELSLELTRLLQRENIASAYDTTVKEELETKALAAFTEQTYPNTWQTLSPAQSIARINEDSLIKMGKTGTGQGETFDVLASSDEGEMVIEQTLAALHEAGPEFVSGVRAIETTMMTNNKYFQVIMEDNITDLVDATSKLLAVGEAAVAEALDVFNMVGRNLSASYDEIIAVDSSHEGGPEDITYFAQQLTSRMMEFQNDAFSGGELGEAFVFQMPVGKYMSGYVRLEPQFGGDDTLSGVGVMAHVLGGADYQALTASLTVDIDGEEVPIFYPEGADNSFAGHRNMLVYQLYQQGIRNPMDLFNLVYGAPLQDTLNDLALAKSGRGEMMGSSLRTMLEVGLGNAITQSAVVGAVEVLSSREGAESLQRQITAYFEDPGVRNALTHFYEEAMKGSGEVTNTWRDSLQGGNRQGLQLLQGGPYADASETAPFTSQKNLEGIGMPWSLSIGRDPSGFEKFKKRETHPNTEKFSEGIQQKRVSQYSEPLQVIPGTRAKPVGVRVDPEVFDPTRQFGGQVNQYIEGREVAYDPRTRYITKTASVNARDSAPMNEAIFEGEVASLEQEFSRSRMGRM